MLAQEKHPANGNRKQVGYFCHLKIDEKHLGGILVTNQIGVPLEFKYTEPVVATRLHKILYGSVLERYIHETILRDRLAREVHIEPDYFIEPYDDKEFLSTIGGKECMAVQRYTMPSGEPSGTFTRIRDREVMVGLEEGPVLRIAFSTVDDALQHEMVTWLQEIHRSMDILEPLDRVFAALKSLCGEEKKA